MVADPQLAAGQVEPAFLDKQTGAFFRKIDWCAFWTTLLIGLCVYVYTLAPTVTLEDSGELAVASDYLGVPHPPGYPIWTLVTWFFQWVFHFVTYHGQPNPAWSVGLASAVAGAMACALLALLVSRSGADMLRSVKRITETIGYSTENLLCWVGGVASGLLLCFSPVLWSQSVIVEVYALNAFFQVLVLLLTYMWMCRPKDDKILFAAAFIFGLGLTNHQTLLFLGLALAIAVLLKDQKLFRDFAIVGAGVFLLILINTMAKSKGYNDLLWVQGPTSKAFWVYSILAVAIPILGAFVLPRGRTVCITFLLAELGVLFYAYLPFASEQNPPMNWGYPRTWEGFLHAVSRGQYEKITPTDIFSEKFIMQVGSYLTDLRGQFTLPIAILGFLPFCSWAINLKGRRWSALFVALALGLGATLLILMEAMIERFAPGSTVTHGIVETLYRVLILGILGLMVLGFFILLVRYVESTIRTFKEYDLMTMIVLVLITAGVLLGVLFADYQLLKAIFSGNLPAKVAVIFLGAVVAPPLLAAGVWFLTRKPFEVEFEIGQAQQRWIIASVIGFISVSIIFMIFQNPQLDIQTLFIGRVQFIQSHAVYAIWLGYGLIFALGYAESFFGGTGMAKVAGVFLAALLPLVLLWQNAYDEEQLRIVGGAEQNGHDFGWQFGNWQLLGVEGIESDLRFTLSEEAFAKAWAEYPTPGYPKSMETNAIFYGGTDPGRFVPTYMIYSAKVRPDVYLITQNALADNTYMNVMRDLYGDTIYIPSQQDSNEAFQQYVNDVQSGKIPAGADVSFENGRVSVQGVQGVMTINGILAKKIFEMNKYKHAFYVEESYVIPWMYPYLEPHGLIMKINREPLAELTPEMISNDHKFWTWYATNLLSNPKFIRDVVARKTFSKLRSAIAGLYAFRRNFEEAEYAFQQAIDLYPLSPEANFRLADIFMQQRRFGDAQALIAEFLKMDPANDKVGEFLRQIEETNKAEARRVELEKMLFQDQSGDIMAAMELAELYRRLGMDSQFVNLTLNIINDANLPPQVCLAIARMYAESRRVDLLAEALQKYVARDPNNLNIWIDLAAAQLMLQRKPDSLESIRRAIALSADQARNIIRADERFTPLHNDPQFRAMIPLAAAPRALPLNLPNLPGIAK